MKIVCCGAAPAGQVGITPPGFVCSPAWFTIDVYSPRNGERNAVYVIGTAGHVDHGKSTLVLALTGIDPDRLKEEKERGMTIDLGFAWLRFPAGTRFNCRRPRARAVYQEHAGGRGGATMRTAGIVAGRRPDAPDRRAPGILHLLGVDRGIVVLTKRDLVDEEWLALVEEEVRGRIERPPWEARRSCPCRPDRAGSR